mgnify:CR=1 FL=1
MLNHVRKYNHFNLFIVAILGFSCGLPLALTGAALQGWLVHHNVNIVTIGMLGLVTQPYIFKFLWAPLVDRYAFPFLGHRTGWIFAMQWALIIVIASITFFEPTTSPYMFAMCAFAIAFFSATQDIAFDAYRTELLTESERGLGSVIYVYGYRIALLISGGGALILSAYIGWEMTYLFMAFLMAVCSVITLFAKESRREVKQSLSLSQTALEPFREFMTRNNAVLLIALLLTYKIGEAFAFSLTTPFLIQSLHFTAQEVGVVSKTMGLIAMLIGLSIGGGLIDKLGLYKSLLWFGVLQSLAILSFLWLATVGHNYGVMAFTILIDQFASGLGTAALMVLLMSVCNTKYTATQFALLSAVISVPRVYVLPISGAFIASYGWESFFWFAFLVSLPSLVIVRLLRNDINSSVDLGNQSRNRKGAFA